MAKIKHANFLDTIDQVLTEATKEGVIHQYADDTEFTGRKISIDSKPLFHFGTTGYLGLEQDSRLKNAAISAIHKYGTQFPLSKTYISHPLYAKLEEQLESIYGLPVIITKNSTLGHIAIIPTAVEDEDQVILDHQVHWSVQSACDQLKIRGISVSMIRHNNMEMLEDKLRKNRSTSGKTWYMADGIYSMFGDATPVEDLIFLSNKYPFLNLYFDDVHGMSWCGKNGSGYIMSKLGELPENVLLVGTLSKTFGASGSFLACNNNKLYNKIRNFGGPLTFSAQLEPASVAAAIASASIHLSDEIYLLQNELMKRIHLANDLLGKTELPLIKQNSTPVFYVGTGMPSTGYHLIKNLQQEGYFVNLGLFPAVPVKNTGIRFTISLHNREEDIKGLIETLNHIYPKSLSSTNNTPNQVRKSFRLPQLKDETSKPAVDLKIILKESINEMDPVVWDRYNSGNGVFNYQGLMFLEKYFLNHPDPELNWKFYYLQIFDLSENVILQTFFTVSLWKDDMLAPVSVSQEIEKLRKDDKYEFTSQVLSTGSLFTEGDHLFIDENHPLKNLALDQFHLTIDHLKESNKAELVVLRDFTILNSCDKNFKDRGYLPVEMPHTAIIELNKLYSDSHWIQQLSKKSRRHFKNELEPFLEKGSIQILDQLNSDELQKAYQLYLNVWNQNKDINTFAYSASVFENMNKDPSWRFIILNSDDRLLGIMFCFLNGTTFIPSLVGIDYKFNQEFAVYRRLLYESVEYAIDLKCQKIEFGFSASFEKKKFGATIKSRIAYFQTDDNYKLENLGIIRSDIVKHTPRR